MRLEEHGHVLFLFLSIGSTHFAAGGAASAGCAQSLKVKCETFTGNCWHKMEQKVRMHASSYMRSLKKNK